MKGIIRLVICAILCAVAAGCASIVTNRANLDGDPDGIRLYPPKVYLFVDTSEKRSLLQFLPDYKRAYDVSPRTFLAKQDFKIETEDGQLKSFTASQDTTAALTFFSTGATIAAKAAGFVVSATVINGTFGLESGIYQLGDDGVFRKMTDRK
jgi:hypothetical protein